MTEKIALIESPLSADTAEGFARNRNYALWACRHTYELYRDFGRVVIPVATHLVCPFYLDDRDPLERAHGIGLRAALLPVAFEVRYYTDLGISPGMRAALDADLKRFARGTVGVGLPPEMFAAVEAGTPPPHTPGFDLTWPAALEKRDG